jgi:hypothetical protein
MLRRNMVGLLVGEAIDDARGLRIEPLTRWFPYVFAPKIKAAVLINGVVGSSTLEYKLSFQTATTSVEQPSGAAATWYTGASFDSYNTLSPGGNTERNTGELTIPGTITDMWVRIGVIYQLSSGTTQTTSTLDALVTSRT